MDIARQHSFRRWAPDIGENRELEGGPGLWFELAIGLSADQLQKITARIARSIEDMQGKQSVDEVKAIQATAYAEAFATFVRIVDGPHSVAGMPLETLPDYIGIVQKQADFGTTALTDLQSALIRFNSFSGPDELFSLRRSGGLGTTARPSVVKGPAAKPKARKRAR